MNYGCYTDTEKIGFGVCKTCGGKTLQFDVVVMHCYGRACRYFPCDDLEDTGRFEECTSCGQKIRQEVK